MAGVQIECVTDISVLLQLCIGRTSSAGGLNLLGGLGSGSESVLEFSIDGLEISHSSGSGSLSSDGLGGPVVSSSLGVFTTSGLSVLLVLLVEVGSSRESADHMGVSSLSSGSGCSSRLKEININIVFANLPLLFKN